MKIVVVLRQVPDLIEPLEIADSQTELDMDGASFLVNESDDHAVEQAILIKEAIGGEVVVVAPDYGDVDDTLYAAAAKGADKIIKIPVEDEKLPGAMALAAMLAEAIEPLGAELVLIGCQAHDEMEGALGPVLALNLNLPYVGVIRGVKPAEGAASVKAHKEFPGAVMAEYDVQLPAVLGILAAEQPPRYVSVSRIRSAMGSTEFEEAGVAAATAEPPITVRRMYPPEIAERAEMITGSEEDVAARIVEILVEKGVMK